MKNKIVLEEHFATTDTIGDSQEYFPAQIWPERRHQLLDFQTERLERMDACGIGFAILSLNAQVIQGIPDSAKAIDVARRANDRLAEQVAARPTRFGAFAALPMQDPDAAVTELHRAVKDLGFLGGLVNGFSQVGSLDNATYYDLPQYRPFWSEVARLRVPFYLHPRNPLPSQQLAYEGHPWLLGPPWGFSVETGIHALRLMGSGLFDEFPTLTVILGHLGELVTNNIWRTSHWASLDGKHPLGVPMKQSFIDCSASTSMSPPAATSAPSPCATPWRRSAPTVCCFPSTTRSNRWKRAPPGSTPPRSARTTAITSAAAMPPDSSISPITSDVRQTQRSGAHGRESAGASPKWMTVRQPKPCHVEPTEGGLGCRPIAPFKSQGSGNSNWRSVSCWTRSLVMCGFVCRVAVSATAMCSPSRAC